MLCRRRTGNCSMKPTGQAWCGIASRRTMRLSSLGRTYFSTATPGNPSPFRLSSSLMEGSSSATTFRVSTVKRLRTFLRVLHSRGTNGPQTPCRPTSPRWRSTRSRKTMPTTRTPTATASRQSTSFLFTTPTLTTRTRTTTGSTTAMNC